MRISGTALFGLLVCSVLFVLPYSLSAQGLGSAAVASSFFVTGTVEDGDIISYVADSGTYERSERSSDPDIFGVVVLDPIIHVTQATVDDGSVPIVRFGEVVVNVTDLSGEIHAGDVITTSVLPGLGARASRSERSYIIGIALDDVVPDTTREPIQIGGQRVVRGTVLVALRMGFYDPNDEDLLEGRTASGTAATPDGAAIAESAALDKKEQFDLFMVFRYVLAAAVALAAIMLALRSFGGALSQSIISVGRNPLARSVIVTMMLWNSFLILLVSSVGLGIGAAIIFLP